ncbi:hypothetical protein AUP68_01163 [Ilyonectria robusta]
MSARAIPPFHCSVVFPGHHLATSESNCLVSLGAMETSSQECQSMLTGPWTVRHLFSLFCACTSAYVRAYALRFGLAVVVATMVRQRPIWNSPVAQDPDRRPKKMPA